MDDSDVFQFFRESKLTLKSVFDNVRNYIICATLFAINVWFRKEAAKTPEYIDRFFTHMWGYGFLAAAIVLTLLNIAQSYLLVLPAYVELSYRVSKRAEKPSSGWWAHIADAFVDSMGTPIVVSMLIMIVYLVVILYKGTAVGGK